MYNTYNMYSAYYTYIMYYPYNNTFSTLENYSDLFIAHEEFSVIPIRLKFIKYIFKLR